MKRFDTTKTVTYWIDGAKYDIGVANAMLKARKFPYALFMGHLALEKLLKAVVVKRTKKHAPFTHSLPYLAEKTGLKFPEHIQIKLREFMEFHFEGRYPDANKAFYKKCTRDFSTRNLRAIKEVFKWVKEKL
ncbi:MAG: HEPN domain-containing protein [Nitrospirota bacterium]